MNPEQMRRQYNILTSAGASLLFKGSTELSEQIQLGANMLLIAADEVDRLRAVIENAPHALFCGFQEEPWRCTCWKADAL